MQKTPSSPSIHNPILGNRWTVAAIVLISTVATVGMTYVLYTTMQSVFRLNLNERLKAMAAVASLHFDPAELDRVGGPASVGTPAYEGAVHALQRIRLLVPNIQYAYILRRTDDPSVMAYVADADSLHPDEPVDLNRDGVIDEEDALVHPGDAYDVSEFPEFQAAAFVEPFVDPDFTTSQWGIFLAGTAPIRAIDDPDRRTDYVIGLDLNVTQYQQLLRQIILPFVIFSAVLLACIVLQAFALRDRWKKQVQQLAETDEAKNQVIGIVAHQLNGVVTKFRWYSEMLRDGSATREECADQVEAGNGELRTLANLFLDAQHIHDNKLELHPVPVDLNRFFKRLAESAALRARDDKKPVLLKASIPNGLPTVWLDEDYTYFSMDNLLSNAVKYTPRNGSVDFRVTIRQGILSCTVQDTGRGIPKAERDKIFGQMYRASNVRDIKGNGLGLYIAKYAITHQGGTIRYESEGIDGKGTTFFIELPLKLAAGKAEQRRDKE